MRLTSRTRSWWFLQETCSFLFFSHFAHWPSFLVCFPPGSGAYGGLMHGVRLVDPCVLVSGAPFWNRVLGRVGGRWHERCPLAIVGQKPDWYAM